MAAPPTDSFKDMKINLTEEKARNSQTNGSAISRGPSPNRGASVPDTELRGENSKPQSTWISEEGIDKSQWIRLKKLSHMRYQHEDLNQISIFLKGRPRCKLSLVSGELLD